jgi:hypothetical protein
MLKLSARLALSKWNEEENSGAYDSLFSNVVVVAAD